MQEYAQEVDFELFQKKFWPKYGSGTRYLTPDIVWTEIYSIIKGSHNCSQFANKALPRDHYI